jgi:hypothetical protein
MSAPATYRLQIKLDAPPLSSTTMPPPARADRAEMIAALAGSLSLLSADTQRAGRAYREALCQRIKSIIERERVR